MADQPVPPAPNPQPVSNEQPDSNEQRVPQGPGRRERASHWLLFMGLFALVAALVVTFELDPTLQPSPRLPWGRGRVTFHQVLISYQVLTGLGALGVAGWVWLTRKGRRASVRLRIAARVILTVLTLVSGFNYFYGQHGLSTTMFAHRWDTFHYLLGPRWYDEVDYADLYNCAVEDLSQRDVPDRTPVRDLSNYHMTTAGKLRAEQRCKDKFTPEQREQWRKDLEVYTWGDGRGTLRSALGDRGFNGTPFETAIAQAIATRFPLTFATHNLAPLLDVGLTCIMLAGVAAAFGWEIGLVFALFFFTDAADRWAVIGGSFLRYPWMATLGLGIAALKRQRYGMAGVLLALSSLLNVFPAVFAVGVVVRAAVHFVRERRLLPRYRRFLAAAAVTGVLGLGIGALPARGVGNYVSWYHDMQLHGVERFQGFGTGLKFPFIFRGGTNAKNDRVAEHTRKRWFHQVRPWFYLLATGVLTLAVGFAVRTEDDVEAATVLGFTLFFTTLGTVCYYFAAAAVAGARLPPPGEEHRRRYLPGPFLRDQPARPHRFVPRRLLPLRLQYRSVHGLVGLAHRASGVAGSQRAPVFSGGLARGAGSQAQSLTRRGWSDAPGLQYWTAGLGPGLGTCTFGAARSLGG